MEKDDKITLEKTISIFNVLYADKIYPCTDGVKCTTIESKMQEIKDLSKHHDESAKEHRDMIVRLREDPTQEMTEEDYIIHENYVNELKLFREGCKEFLDYLITLSEEEALRDGISRGAIKKINDILGKSNFGEVVKGILGKVFSETTSASTVTAPIPTTSSTIPADEFEFTMSRILTRFLETFMNSKKEYKYKEWFVKKFKAKTDTEDPPAIPREDVELLNDNIDNIGEGKGQILNPYISSNPTYDKSRYYEKKTDSFNLSRFRISPQDLYNGIIDDLRHPGRPVYGGKSRNHRKRRTKHQFKFGKKTRKHN